MRNIRVVVEYEGTDYHGFAIQRGLRTVQGELEEAVGKITGVKTRVIGAGRTDAGAHAMGQVASFKSEARLSASEFQRALNANLPDDILVRAVDEAPDGFDARRSARKRWYRYSIWNAPLPDVWIRRIRLHVEQPLDVKAMNDAAKCLIGTRDFACFTFGLAGYLRSGKRRTTVRTIFDARWNGTAPELDFDIAGTAFLPHMIRNMVGSMLRVGQGRLGLQEFRSLVENGSGQLSTWTVPAHGLTLVKVEY